MRTACIDLKVVKEFFFDFHLIFDRTQLSAFGESLLCDYPVAVDYIQEINFMTRRIFKNDLFTFNGPIESKLMSEGHKTQVLSSAFSQIMKNDPLCCCS